MPAEREGKSEEMTVESKILHLCQISRTAVANVDNHPAVFFWREYLKKQIYDN